MEDIKKETIREKWVKLYNTISLHGFHYIFETTGIPRILWIILFVGMVCCSVALFYGNIYDFVHYKTTSVQDEIFDIEHLEFPTVTICNMNSVSAKKLDQANITTVSRSDLIDFYERLRGGEIKAEGHDKEILEAIEKETNITSWRRIITMFELGIEEMLHDQILNSFVKQPCSFNGKPCTEKDFVPIISEPYGLCFQYNSFYQDRKMYVTSAGVRSGLQLYLNIHEDDMLISQVPYQGLKVFVHPSGTPFESAVTKRAPVRPGSFTLIHVRVNMMELLGSPYHTKCSSKPYKYVRPSVPYFNSMCTIDCLIDKMVKRCGCVALEMSHHTANMSQILHKCRPSCPRECNVVTYHIDSAQTMIGNKIVNKKVKSFFNSTEESTEYIRKNIVGIDVAFADLGYTIITQKPTTTWSILFGEIGGSLGLCLGCSLVTLVELVVFGIQWLIEKLSEKKRKEKSVN